MSQVSGFDTIQANLDRLLGEQGRIEQALIAGLDMGAAEMQAAAKATTAYHDQTGAKRASTVAYVGGQGVESGGQAGDAIGAARERNPSHVHVEGIADGGRDMVHVVLTDFMDYSAPLETDLGGDRASLGPTFERHAPAVAQAGWQAVAEVFR